MLVKLLKRVFSHLVASSNSKILGFCEERAQPVLDVATEDPGPNNQCKIFVCKGIINNNNNLPQRDEWSQSVCLSIYLIRC